ncbi:MAG: type II toxin-antitoxin system PemK/MazF family toxin [Nanoarchaeota archaeon]
MEQFVKGEVIVTPFPFSDLTTSIRRPALIVANLKGDDVMLCQITTKKRQDPYVIDLSKEDFKSGSIKIASFIKPSKIFTLRKKIILYKIGKLTENKIKEVENKIFEIIKNSQ